MKVGGERRSEAIYEEASFTAAIRRGVRSTIERTPVEELYTEVNCENLQLSSARSC